MNCLSCQIAGGLCDYHKELAMSNSNDVSDSELLALARKATPGEWAVAEHEQAIKAAALAGQKYRHEAGREIYVDSETLARRIVAAFLRAVETTKAMADAFDKAFKETPGGHGFAIAFDNGAEAMCRALAEEIDNAKG